MYKMLKRELTFQQSQLAFELAELDFYHLLTLVLNSVFGLSSQTFDAQKDLYQSLYLAAKIRFNQIINYSNL